MRILSPPEIIRRLKKYPNTQRYIVALSGGLDSHVLLHLVSAAAKELSVLVAVVHIHHGLSQESTRWSSFCLRLCKKYRIACRVRHITQACPSGRSIEAWAREHRYRLISDEMGEHDILFTAHHADDQTETVLLHLLRGSGPRGLAAMTELQSFYKGWHARPLLSYTRQQLTEYAERYQLEYIVDHSNEDIRYNRNYLRKEVMPLLRKRWPGMHATLSRVAAHQRVVGVLIDDLAADDFLFIKDRKQTINCCSLRALSRQRQTNVLLYWLRLLRLPPPEKKHIDQLIDRVVYANDNSVPCVNWHNVEVRRYRDLLYAIPALPAHDIDRCLDWRDMQRPLDLPLGKLTAARMCGPGLAARLFKKNRVQIRFRKGGEKLRPHKRTYTIAVKHLFQEHGIIPWLRNLVPMLYIGDQLAAIPGLCIADSFIAKEGEAAWIIIWDQYDSVVQEK